MVQLSNKCSSDVSSKTFYIPNSGVNQYTYGENSNEDSYQQTINDKLNEGYTSIECPRENPYPNGDKCMSCPEKSFFDLSKNQCLTCP